MLVVQICNSPGIADRLRVAVAQASPTNAAMPSVIGRDNQTQIAVESFEKERKICYSAPNVLRRSESVSHTKGRRSLWHQLH
jgi:hypothetical protein